MPVHPSTLRFEKSMNSSAPATTKTGRAVRNWLNAHIRRNQVISVPLFLVQYVRSTGSLLFADHPTTSSASSSLARVSDVIRSGVSKDRQSSPKLLNALIERNQVISAPITVTQSVRSTGSFVVPDHLSFHPTSSLAINEPC